LLEFGYEASAISEIGEDCSAGGAGVMDGYIVLNAFFAEYL